MRDVKVGLLGCIELKVPTVLAQLRYNRVGTLGLGNGNRSSTQMETSVFITWARWKKKPHPPWRVWSKNLPDKAPQFVFHDNLNQQSHLIPFHFIPFHFIPFQLLGFIFIPHVIRSNANTGLGREIPNQPLPYIVQVYNPHLVHLSPTLSSACDLLCSPKLKDGESLCFDHFLRRLYQGCIQSRPLKSFITRPLPCCDGATFYILTKKRVAAFSSFKRLTSSALHCLESNMKSSIN